MVESNSELKKELDTTEMRSRTKYDRNRPPYFVLQSTPQMTRDFQTTNFLGSSRFCDPTQVYESM